MMQVWKPSWIGSWGWGSACIRRDRRLPFQVLTFCISLFLLVFSSLTYYLTLSIIAWRRTTLGMTWNTCSSVPRAPSASSPESPYPAPPDPGEYGQLKVVIRLLTTIRSVNLAFLSLPDFPSVLDTFRECKVKYRLQGTFYWVNSKMVKRLVTFRECKVN